MSMRLFIVAVITCCCSVSYAATAAIRAGAGALLRDGGPDLMYRAGASARLINGLQLHIQFAGDFTSERALLTNTGSAIAPPHVDEWHVLGGFGYRAANSERFYIDGIFLLGPLFRQVPGTLHAELIGELVGSFGIRIVEGLSVELRVAPGIEKHANVVSPDGQYGWHRGNLFLETSVMLAYDFDPHAGEHEPVDF